MHFLYFLLFGETTLSMKFSEHFSPTAPSLWKILDGMLKWFCECEMRSEIGLRKKDRLSLRRPQVSDMHDAHCHADQHQDPENFCQELEAKEIYTIAVTNLPSHYALALSPLKNLKYVRPALGLHPLLANRHTLELAAFERLSRFTNLIGEVGLDFSPEGIASKELQLRSFRHVLKCIAGKSKFISLHSRRAEDAVLSELRNFGVTPAVFHWFTGSVQTCEAALKDGHFFLG